MTSTDFGDPGCFAALAEAVGHAPPFSTAELEAIESLTVAHARDLTPLTACTGLRTLRVLAADLKSDGDPEMFAALAKLERVELIASSLESTIFLLDCTNLNRKDLLFSSFPDLSQAGDEVLGTAGSGTIIGVPFDAPIGEYLAGMGELRSEYERAQCARLFERTGAVFGLIADEYGLLVRPGLPVFTGNAFDAIHLSTAELERALDDPECSLETLFGRFEVVAPDLPAQQEQTTTRPVQAVRRWLIDVELPMENRLGVDRFMQRYPGVPLHTDPDDLLDRLERAYSAGGSTHYALRAKLAGWLLLRDCPPIRLGETDAATIYAIGLQETDPDPLDLLLEAGYLVVGRAIDQPGRVLLFELDDNGRVIEANEDAFLDALAERHDPAAGLTVLFTSLGELLNAVSSIHPERVVAPRPTETLDTGHLHRDVLLELRRLKSLAAGRPDGHHSVSTPVGAHAVPPAIQELMTISWPAGQSARTKDFGWRVRFAYAPIEAGLVPEARAWLGIAEDDGQYTWIVDLADEHSENPTVYRVDHGGQDNLPYGEQLSDILAGCSLRNDEP